MRNLKKNDRKKQNRNNLSLDKIHENDCIQFTNRSKLMSFLGVCVCVGLSPLTSIFPNLAPLPVKNSGHALGNMRCESCGTWLMAK